MAEQLGDVFQVFFKDLTPEAQGEYLRFSNLKTPEEGNLDVYPIFVLEKSDESDSEETDKV